MNSSRLSNASKQKRLLSVPALSPKRFLGRPQTRYPSVGNVLSDLAKIAMENLPSTATGPDRAQASAIRNLTLPILVAVLALAFWDTFLVYPLKILVVLFHELSHGLAAVLTGGAIEHIEISFDQGGVCYTRGGSSFVILNAGYVGSLGAGAAMLVLGARTRHDRFFVGLLGAALLVVTLVYIRSRFGFVYGILAGSALLAISWKLPEGVSDALLTVLGTVSCLYAVWDIGSDVIFRHIPGSDAYRLAELTGIPSVAWGVVWVALCLVVTFEALAVVSRKETTRVW